jgi:hypothetical protein
MAKLTFVGQHISQDLQQRPSVSRHQINMAKSVAPPVVAVDNMPDGLFLHFADGRSAFYSYELLYATIETAQVVSPEMNNRNRASEEK